MRAKCMRSVSYAQGRNAPSALAAVAPVVGILRCRSPAHSGRRRLAPSADAGGMRERTPVQIYNPSLLDIDSQSREPIGWRALGNMRAAVRPVLG